ncbi:uncharacterized protein LOC107610771 [Arachis ipaensis]|uniref:uncharacterized protein LOC107610771 n=1 Tax=Arachis ipaensis TaxID=130454 RepID=UPI0007AF498B|nr:uncharacterized protein LOC107610771 [Arachis ipaensis]
MEWKAEYPNGFVSHLDGTGSKHCRPLLINSEKEERRSRRRFRFQERWCDKKEVSRVVKHAWDLEVVGSLIFRLAVKLKHCRHKLFEWQKSAASNSKQQIQSVQGKLEEENGKRATVDGTVIRILEAELEENLEQEERFWKEKSRVQWLNWGDKNTKFFHSKFQSRCQRNKIQELVDDSGNVASDK